MPNTAEFEALFAAMLYHGGRSIGDTWYTVRSDVTSNCHGQGWSDDRGPQHDACHGWIAPLNGCRECRCPCHDENRPTFWQAKHAVLMSMDEAERASWVYHNPSAKAYL